jgi:hypothetical protein
VNTPVHGVVIEANASRQLRNLQSAQRKLVVHILEEMVAVVELTNGEAGSLGRERLSFTAAGVRVEYSIDSASSALTVHEIQRSPYARAG